MCVTTSVLNPTLNGYQTETSPNQKRVLLLKEIKQSSGSISDLARKLKRDRSAVTRDVQLLESVGVVHVTVKPLPGHGTQKWVTPVAREIRLTADL